ncbi:hypothetical protein BDV40DRAFT_267800 [Aspergillus tamarii]|uniref:Uncharacterized protein n=1 Tax=Aspergillus tamarii TaxID=41984 RepID=A0A5N6URX1_ASPTM|nr:hypothetical protein BDV40DRAFT_267800 [Aspergillus tamarii]
MTSPGVFGRRVLFSAYGRLPRSHGDQKKAQIGFFPPPRSGNCILSLGKCRHPCCFPCYGYATNLSSCCELACLSVGCRGCLTFDRHEAAD